MLWTFLRAVVQGNFGRHAYSNPRSNALFLMPASNESSLVPARPGADGMVQHGITPADTVACQTGGHRPGHGKHSHTVPPYGNSVCAERSYSAGCMACFDHKSENKDTNGRVYMWKSESTHTHEPMTIYQVKSRPQTCWKHHRYTLTRTHTQTHTILSSN